MTSLDIRNNSAVMKRAEQLKRWEESDTNREPPTPRPEKGRRIKFSSGCVFLAACLAGDKEEVVKLLEHGADINTANVDGLTALHQACIDDNLEMVEFLVENGADINRQDNEGWTPLHATASCGFVSIARYLVEHGADVAAVNSDGDLALDLAVDIQHLPMIDYMQKMVNECNIDCDKARQAEEQLMLSDAKKWLRSDASEVDRPHPKTGATALHVAAAKGYTKVLSLLLAGRANVDKQDNDGWTPLHAAAHWGQKDAAEMLVDAMADIDVRNYAGQTCIDVAERKMVKFLEELRANNKRIKRRPSSQIRISEQIENHMDNSSKIIRVELKPDQSKEQGNDDKVKPLTDSNKTQSSADQKPTEDEAPWRRNSGIAPRTRPQNDSPTKIQVPEKEINKVANAETSDVILRRTQSFENDEKFYKKYHELRARIKANSCPILPATQNINNSSSNINNNNNNINNNNNSTTLNNITATTCTVTTSSNSIINPTSALGVAYNTTNTTNTTTTTSIPNFTVQRSASLKDHFRSISSQSLTVSSPKSTITSTTSITTPPSTVTTTAPLRRSFVPPVRDEESETQRKAHAKRVRETRRSTQGVTLDEIKSAEELVKKKNLNMNNNNNNNNNNNSSNFKLEDANTGNTYPPNNSTIIPSAPAVIAAANLSSVSQRRLNSGANSLNASNQSLNSIGRPTSNLSFLSTTSSSTSSSLTTSTSDSSLLDNNQSASTGTFTIAGKRLNSVGTSTTSITAPNTVAAAVNTVAPETSSVSTSTITFNNRNDDKDNDKENNSRSALAAQGVIQRRRKPKRRSTGVVHLDMDDLDPDRQDSANDTEDKESGSERNSRSRLSSTSGATNNSSATDDNKARDKSENGEEIDYKALWEAAKLENDKLKQQLKKKDDEIVQTRATLERFTNATTKNSLSEIEKRERRAMERKLSEMEEELKLLQKLKTENDRLRAENRALTRVVSKLTTSAQNQLSKSK